MAGIPPTFQAVSAHLEDVQSDPTTPLDVPLIEKLQAELTAATDRSVPAALLTRISQLLPVLQEDPTPITTLGIKATAYLTFSDLRSFQPAVDFIAGLKAASPPVNLLALSLLSKAGRLPSDAAIVAGDPELVASLVELWLSTTSSAVAQAAFDAIWALLEVDLASPLEAADSSKISGEGVEGQGLMWRRMFTDKDVYSLLFSLCSLRATGAAGLSKREKTVAQGRLMDFLAKAGRLRWDIISGSQISDVEAQHECHSLLQFAACRMVDTGDVLMHMTLLNFFRELLQIDAPGLVTRTVIHSATTFSSPALDFLIEHELHSTVLMYYLDESKLDSVDLMYLSAPIQSYVADYAELYPNHLLKNPRPLLDGIVSRLLTSLAISSAQWAHGPVPAGQLAILSSLPRVLLVETFRRPSSPLQSLRTSVPCKEVLHALAKILHGPTKPEDAQAMELNTAGQTPTDWHREAAAARVLYFSYLNSHPNTWADIVAAADIVAMKDVSLAAITFMKAIVTANWQTLSPELVDSSPEASPFRLPTEDELGRLSPAAQGVLPTSGVWAVLTPPALTTLLPYLFKPPRSYTEFAGGGAGDAEHAVWKIATAKYEVLVALHDRLKESSASVAGFEDILRTLKQRVSEGPWGPATRAGNRVEAVGM